MSCFNSGQDGGHSILFSYAQIMVVTNRYSPKIILLEFNPEDLVYKNGDYEKLSILLPYFRNYPEIKSVILLRENFENIKILSDIYPFNSNIASILRNNIPELAKHNKNFDGYIPLQGEIADNQKLLQPEKPWN